MASGENMASFSKCNMATYVIFQIRTVVHSHITALDTYQNPPGITEGEKYSIKSDSQKPDIENLQVRLEQLCVIICIIYNKMHQKHHCLSLERCELFLVSMHKGSRTPQYPGKP